MRRYRRLAPFALRQWPGLLLIFALTAAMSAAGVLQPWPLKLLVDHALGSAPTPDWVRSSLTQVGLVDSPATLLLVSAGATLLLFLVNSLLDGGLTWAWAYTGQRLVYGLASEIFARLQRLSMLYHARQRVGDSLSRITGDSWCVFTLVDGLLISPAQHILNIVLIGAVAFWLDPQLALATLTVAPVLGASAYFFGKSLKRRARLDREASSRLMSFVHQTLTAIPVVQAFTSESRNRQRFDLLASDSVTTAQKGVFLRSTFSLVNGLATAAGVAVVIYLGGRRVLSHELPLGNLLVFMAYVNSLRSASQGLLGTYANIRGADAGVDRVLEVLDAPERVIEKPGAADAPAGLAAADVRIEGVTFGYEPGRPVLRNLSLTAAPGQVIALVGSTGSGKSTAVSLVPRFFDPWEGRVLVGGVDVRELKIASLRSRISLVLQEPFLLPMTIAENIAYGRPGATREEIEAAAVDASADEFIRKLPEGYDTVLSERGASLSGGQRQRLSIARALLKDAPLLILDEPTSALDARTESTLLAALDRLMKGRTTLVIAHRLSTVRRADRILVLDQGAVVEQGTHAELVAAGGVYAHLHSLQLATPIAEALA